jgi:hypothetical protein
MRLRATLLTMPPPNAGHGFQSNLGLTRKLCAKTLLHIHDFWIVIEIVRGIFIP